MEKFFDPNQDMPDKLRAIFEWWRDHPPRLQANQYGPLDKYFNIKFPECLVKPQGLLRISGPGAEIPGDDHGEDAPRRSIDSYGKPFDPNDDKRYPDFIIASYYAQNPDGSFPFHRIRVIVEVGSLGSNKPAGRDEEVEAKKVGTEAEKKHVADQLHNYCSLIGAEDDARFHQGAFGVGIIGTEVCFVTARKVNGVVLWTTPGKWYSMFGDEWNNRMERAAKIAVMEAEI